MALALVASADRRWGDASGDKDQEDVDEPNLVDEPDEPSWSFLILLFPQGIRTNKKTKKRNSGTDKKGEQRELLPIFILRGGRAHEARS